MLSYHFDQFLVLRHRSLIKNIKQTMMISMLKHAFNELDVSDYIIIMMINFIVVMHVAVQHQA